MSLTEKNILNAEILLACKIHETIQADDAGSRSEKEAKRKEETGDDDDEEEESKPVVDELYRLYYKKFNKQEFDDEDTAFLKQIMKKKANIKDKALGIASRLLSKEELDVEEDMMLKLSLSNTMNLIHPYSYEASKKLLTKKEMKAVDKADAELFVELSDEDKEILKKVLKSGGDEEGDTDSIIVEILKEQVNLRAKGQKSNDTYKLLDILRGMIENIESYAEADSELTSYQHCAKLLDCLFRGTELKILDGEPGCLATKEQMILNHSLFPSSAENALSTSAIRKIDAIVVTNLKNERVKLSTNEWKKGSVSSTTAMKQQSKSIRTNASILNQLNRKYSIKTKKVVAVDFIGNAGYMYSLEEKEGVFVANLIEEVFFPTSTKEIKHVSSTINTLFKFKNHLKKLAAEATEAFEMRMSATRLKGVTRLRVHEEAPCDVPRVMFSPKSKKKKVESSRWPIK